MFGMPTGYLLESVTAQTPHERSLDSVEEEATSVFLTVLRNRLLDSIPEPPKYDIATIIFYNLESK